MSVEGTWNIAVKTPIGVQRSAITLRVDAGALSGTTDGILGQQSFTGTARDDHAEWTMAITAPMTLTLDFVIDVVGDTMTGTVKAGLFGTSDLTGVRLT